MSASLAEEIENITWRTMYRLHSPLHWRLVAILFMNALIHLYIAPQQPPD